MKAFVMFTTEDHSWEQEKRDGKYKAYKKHKFVTEKPKVTEGRCRIDLVPHMMEFKTIEDLIEFKKEIREEIIIRLSCPSLYPESKQADFIVEVYNNYRE